jgi:Fe-S cluster assembly protein SufB
MSSQAKTIEDFTNADYKHGFVTEIEEESIPKGLSEDVVRLISAKKEEPAFLLEWRLKAYRKWLTMTEPAWANVHYPPIDYQEIVYYSAPKQNKKDGPKSLDEVDPKLLETYEKLGIPLRERAILAGVAVDAVFDSVSVATTFKEKLGELGIVFCSFSEAVRTHPDLVRKYLGSVVPYSDNFFATLNSAVFSDGSFVYVPKGVKCPMELSTYFRINAKNTGQFERTLIVADEGASVSYLEGCTARTSSTRPSSSSLPWTTPGSSIRRSRTGIPATRTARAGSTTSSRSAESARGSARRSPGRRWRRDRRSPGSTRAASSSATTRSASSIRWR